MKHGEIEGAAPTCPTCGRALDGWTEVDGDGKPPSGGDLTICLYCRSPLAFVHGESGIVLRHASAEEVDYLRRRFTT